MFSLRKIAHSNATMDLQIIRFTFLLFLFQVIKSHEDESEQNEKISDIVKKILKEYNIEDTQSGEYENSTISVLNKLQEATLENEKQSLRIEKLKVSARLLEEIIEITKCKTNITRYVTKLLAHIEEFRYALVKSMQKESKLMDTDPMQNLDFDALLDFEARQKLSEEYLKTLSELKTLKFKIYSWNKRFQSDTDYADEMSSLIAKFSHNEELPEMVWNEADENLSPEIDPDNGDPFMGNLQRLSLLIGDKLNEMPKSEPIKESVSRDDMDLLTVSDLPGGDHLPRWLLTEKDLEEIHAKYLKWMLIFENSESEKAKEMKEDLLKSGKSISLFCKNLAEYFNYTTILLECTSKDDHECEDMVIQITKQPHYQEIVEFFGKWKL